MSIVIMIVVVVVVLCISSSIGIGIFLSSKKPDNDNYIKNVNKDIAGYDISCYDDGSTKDFCKEKCDNDVNCKGYNEIHSGGLWGVKSGCCYKSANSPLYDSTQYKIDFYAKK